LLRQRLRKSRFAAGDGLGTGLGTTTSNVKACPSKTTTFKFCRPQRDFSESISSPIFFGVGSRPSPLSLSSTPLHFLVLKDAFSIHLNASNIHPINSRSATHSGAASDSNSPKAHRRESCLATIQIKPVSPPRHASVACLLYLSDDVVSLQRRCSTSWRGV
jgi:hypothetical protein